MGVHLALLGFFPIVSEDTPWHLKQGELYVTTLSLPAEDPFAFTTGGREWMKFSWVADVALYAIFRVAGFPGLVLFRLLMLFVIAIVLYWILRGCGLDPLTCTLLVFAASLAVRFRLLVRPEIFSFVILLLLMAILVRIRDGSPRLPYLLLPLQALWTNVHASFVFGIALPGLVLLSNLVPGERLVPGWGRLRLDRPRIAHLAVAVLCLPLAAMLNPHGASLLLFPLRQNRMVRLTTFGEWVEIWRLPEFGPPWWTPVAIFGIIVLAFALSAVMLWAWEKRLDPVGWGILLCMGTYAAFRSRAIPYFVLAIAPFLALALVRVSRHLRDRARDELPHRWERLGALGCLLLLSAAIGTTAATGVPFRLGFGPPPNTFPEGAAAFLERHRLDGRVFNAYHYGGYLLWRRWPANSVIIDGRYDAVLFDEEFFETYREAHRSPAVLDQIADRYAIDILFLDARPTNRLVFLDGHPRWARVYWDAVAEIFLRRTPEHSELISAQEYRLTGPTSDTSYLASYRGDTTTWMRAMEELRRAVRDNPENTLAWLALAQEYRTAGPEALAKRVEALAHAVTLLDGRPMEGRALAELAEALLQSGRDREAAVAARDALQADKDLLLPHWVLASVAEKDGSRSEAQGHLRTLLRRMTPDHPMGTAVRERLRALEGSTGRSEGR